MNAIETKNSVLKTAQQPLLPPLIKQSTTYKLLVPQKVEEKIRYLIRKFPSTEWSGVLFYSHTGSFENGDLLITCEDIFPMDLGSGTFTNFKMDESVVGYIAENIDLFGCNMGLVHSHHRLGAFLSGTDLNTVREEGNDTNCFVSLVVDTKGTYVAALTRKVKKREKIITENLSSSYEFFGEGSINLPPVATKTEFADNETIEYYMLDVQIEHVHNSLSYLDTRFEEIEAKKSTLPVVKLDDNIPFIPKSKFQYCPDNGFDEDYSFRDYIKNRREKEDKEPMLFSEDEMADMVDTSKWQPSHDIIHHLVCQMITCSFIINKDIDIKQWITRHMEKKYGEIFGEFGADSLQFKDWKEFIVEFVINQYSDSDIPKDVYEDWDSHQDKITSAIYNDLCQYPSNEYIEAYKEVLTRYIL